MMINKKQSTHSKSIAAVSAKLKSIPDTSRIDDFMIPESVWNGVTIENAFDLAADIDKVLAMFKANPVVLKVPNIDYGFEHIKHFMESGPEFIPQFVEGLLAKFDEIPDVGAAMVTAGLRPWGEDATVMVMPQRLPGDLTIGLATQGIVPAVFPNEDKPFDKDSEKAITTLTVGKLKRIIAQYSELHSLNKRLLIDTSHVDVSRYKVHSNDITEVMAEVLWHVTDKQYGAISNISGIVKAIVATEYGYNTTTRKNIYRVANAIGAFIDSLPEEMSFTEVTV